jgi:hypothetical protein
MFAGFPKSGSEIDRDVCSVCDKMGKAPKNVPPLVHLPADFCVLKSRTDRRRGPDRGNSQRSYKLAPKNTQLSHATDVPSHKFEQEFEPQIAGQHRFYIYKQPTASLWKFKQETRFFDLNK